MKSTGIVRRVDELGRVVIPIELRRTLGIQDKDAVEIYVDDDCIILRKYQTNNTCLITGVDSDENLSLADGKIVIDPEVAKEIMIELQSKLDN